MSAMYERARGVSQQQQQSPDADPARSRTHYIRFNSHMLVATTAQAGGLPAGGSDVVRSHHAGTAAGSVLSTT